MAQTTTKTAANSASATSPKQLSAADRAANFNKMTRRMWQNFSTLSAGDNQTIQFNLPKARLMGGVLLEIKGILTAQHASLTTYTPDADAPYSYLANVTMQYNNAFSPFNISGRGLKEFNQTFLTTPVITPNNTAGSRANATLPLVSSSGGTANNFRFFVYLQNQLNDRDPVGLILLQSDETIVNVNITFGTMNDIAPATGGYTFTTSNVSVTLHTETYTIPAAASGFPDISVLKLVQERIYPVVVGINTFALSIGRIYRKLGMVMYSTNSPWTRSADSVITSNIQLIANQADIPYNIAPDQLMGINAGDYIGPLGTSSYVFDFSNNGQPNYGGSRDYVDTKTLTEFWLSFTSSATGFLRVWSECLVPLTNQ